MSAHPTAASSVALLALCACLAAFPDNVIDSLRSADAADRPDSPDWFISQTQEHGRQTRAVSREPGLTSNRGEAPASGPSSKWGGDRSEFLTGACAGFLGHETGHLIANLAEDTHLHLEGVEFGPIPFFTIQPGREQTPREHYITASAGFNAQFLINEWILTEHPRLKNQTGEPFLKGLATFNYALGISYSAVGLLGYGPDERDTNGMADALGWSEESVSLLILAPTLLDHYRYEHPDCEWARDVSRATKLIILGLALSCDN